MSYELHPLCTLFPRLDEAAFASLVADIRVNGKVIARGEVVTVDNRFAIRITEIG